MVLRALHGAAVVNTIAAGFVLGGFGGGRASRLAALLLLKLLSKPLLHAAAALGCHRGVEMRMARQQRIIGVYLESVR